jgi:hypothetical protein
MVSWILSMNDKLTKRINSYLQTIPPAISGNAGHSQTFKVARLLLFGFGLSNQDALPFLRSYSLRCSPPWTEKELAHKIQSARKFGPGKQKPL